MTQKLDLLLVNPGNLKKTYGSLGSSLAGIEPPLWCGLLAGFIREKGHSVNILDAAAEQLDPESLTDKIIEQNPGLVDIVMLGTNPSASSTPKMPVATKILQLLQKRAPNIKTMLSGLHPSALPEQTLQEEPVDFVCVGEGFNTTLELIRTITSGKDNFQIPGLWFMKDGQIKANSSAPLIENLDNLPFAAWDLLPMDKYRAHNWHCFDNITEREFYAAVYTSLGCLFSCDYCNIHALYDNKPGMRYRSPEKVVEEINSLVKEHNIKNIKIIDELFAVKKERVMKICDLLISQGHDLNIWAYARVDTISEPMLAKMKKAGINWLAFGFESASQNVRSGVDKKFNQARVKKAIDMTRDAGIYIMGNFIFGLPDDTHETMKETLDMAKACNFEYVNFYTAMAYPGSQLYLDVLQKGIRLPETWGGYSQYSEDTLPLPTKHLSSSEVLRFRDNAFKEYYNNPAYIKMVRDKFGSAVVDHIKDMLKKEIKRRFI